MIVCYRFRLLPRKSQHRALEVTLESQRQLYNAALEERIGAYRHAGKTITFFDQARGLTEWRRSGDPDALSLPVSLQRATLKRLDDAYRGFFRRIKSGDTPGFPRFRGKGRFNSFGFRQFQGITLKGGRLRFKGMPGGLRVHWHRELPAALIKSCILKRDPKGWSVSFALVVEPAGGRELERAVGLDLGITTFAALSDGGFIPSLMAARRQQARLRRAQRALSRKKPRSGGQSKARWVVRRCHAAVARRRREHLHQASARLLRDYDVIVVERLNVKGLAQGMLAKAIRDASWGKFLSMLRYKAEWAGARLIEVDPYETSQECSGCGLKVAKGLGVRLHECLHCGLSIDRDLNAARNILNRAGVGPGLRNVAGCGMRAGDNLDSALPARPGALATESLS